MRLSFGLEQRLVQKQVLAPRMIQSMEILQLPIQALEARIDQELSENPLLEKQDADPAAPDEEFERENPNEQTDSEKELVVDEAHHNVDDFERLEELDRQVPDYFDETPRKSVSRIEQEAGRQHDTMANLTNRDTTLQEVLELQLRELDVDHATKEAALRIISSLDMNGYLMVTLEDLQPPDATDEDRQRMQRALELVQSLDPTGVGARDLKECLLLQITPDMLFCDELKTLVGSHLDDLKENRLPAIERKTGYSIELIQEAWTELRTLNPKPGAIYQQTIAQTITPDVFLDVDDNGKYVVRLEDSRMPRLRISNYYRQRLMSGEATADEKEYIRRKVNAAQWLIESIEQRRSTLTRVSQAIVDHQTKYLREGPEFIEPLKMQQIADKVGVHVTTVSRAVDDKYIQTERGILPLRQFFVGGTKSDDGEDVAWNAIRMKLQEIVDGEEKSKPYSDDELVRQLGEHGFKVARRTVTKYRKKMGIPSSRQRRDWSKVAK